MTIAYYQKAITHCTFTHFYYFYIQLNFPLLCKKNLKLYLIKFKYIKTNFVDLKINK